MALNISVSDKARKVLESVANRNKKTREDIMKDLGVTLPSVNGALVGLRRNGLIEINDQTGDITATSDGKEFVKPAKGQATQQPAKAAQGATTPAPRSGTKMEQAAKIFEEHKNEPRKSVLALFREIGLTDKGASTYYQTLRHRHGMTIGVAAQRKQ